MLQASLFGLAFEASLMSTDRLYIVWAGFQRRAESICSALGLELRYFPRQFESQALLPISYLLQCFRTVALVLSRRPSEVWIQVPPSFLPHLLLALRWLIRGKWKIVIDCHNATFRAPWSRIPAWVSVMNRCDHVAVHNEEVLATAVGMGIDPSRAHILEDPPADFGNLSPSAQEGMPTVVVPCSFRPDEPIAELLETARLMPGCRFLLTGGTGRAHRAGYVSSAPGNVLFTGFLPEADFNQILVSASVVLGLTTVEGIQLSVANEAIGAGRALVLSDTRVLRAMFGRAAVFSENHAGSLMEAIAEALDNRDELQRRSAELRSDRHASWMEQASGIGVAMG
jgi:glycosyltransferase involved in cell wall biosynthesis